MSVARGLLLGAALSTALFAGLEASCSPARDAALAPALERAACVILRATTQDGTIDTLCATADELAPLVPALVAARAEAPASVVRTLAPVAELPTPKHRVARRRCVAWEPLASEAGALDASE